MPLFGGVTVELDAPELASLAADLRRASRADRRRLTQALAAAGESAARERITAGGPGPDGERLAGPGTRSTRAASRYSIGRAA